MKKLRKIILPTLAVLFIAAFALVITSLDLTPEKPPYTIFNYRHSGASLLYDTLNEMGINISPEFELIDHASDIQRVRIVIGPDYTYVFDNLEEDLFDFTHKGGRVIYAPRAQGLTERELNSLGASVIYSKTDYTLFSYGLGEMFVIPLNSGINENLLTDRTPGYYITEVLDRWNARAALINEACHGYMTEPDFWDAVAAYIKSAIYQFLIAAALVILYLGKRFGRPVPYYEEIEREENEYLKALANVYNKASDGYIVFEAGLKRLIKKIRETFAFSGDDLAGFWKERGLPCYNELLEVLSYDESDFNTRSVSGRIRLTRAEGLLRRLLNSI